jgi:hypothetical protein
MLAISTPWFDSNVFRLFFIDCCHRYIPVTSVPTIGAESRRLAALRARGRYLSVRGRAARARSALRGGKALRAEKPASLAAAAAARTAGGKSAIVAGPPWCMCVEDVGICAQ